jgi:hypothetical protein
MADRLSRQLAAKSETDEEAKVLQDIYQSLGMANPITKYVSFASGWTHSKAISALISCQFTAFFSFYNDAFSSRDMTNQDAFHIELAHELSALLTRLFKDMERKIVSASAAAPAATTESANFFLPLADVYCYWNRARGTGSTPPSLLPFLYLVLLLHSYIYLARLPILLL